MRRPQHSKSVFDSTKRKRLLALEYARTLHKRILKRRGGIPIPDVTKVIEQIRQERVSELTSNRE